MRKEWYIFSVGLVVFLIPFLGFPRQFNSFVLCVVGLSLVAVSLHTIRQAYVHELGLTKPKSTNLENEEEAKS